MTYSVIRWDKIRTHLSRSCIISSYFWMTLAPSGDSRHLQRRWDFTTHAKGYIQYLPRPIFQNIIFMRPLKQLTERLSLEMHDHSEIHFLICCVGHKRGDSRVGEVSEFGEGGLDALLELLGPPQPTSYCWHILIHWSPTWGGQESLLTQVLQYIITILHILHILLSYT